MTRFGSIAMVVGSTLVVTLSACGESSATAQEQGFQHWWPSTPIPTPGLALKSSATPSAQPSAAPSVGQGQDTATSGSSKAMPASHSAE